MLNSTSRPTGWPTTSPAKALGRWCVFTSAGDKNAIHLWLKGNTPRQWDLVVAYYGCNAETFSRFSAVCSFAFRTKGSKFQNLKKFITQYPQFFDPYSHVWVCDDDIVMSADQINEAFHLTETLGFWIAQPALLAGGDNHQWIACAGGGEWDYRIVNYVEVMMPIFRRDKLVQFLAVYDGSLTGWGIDHWYANFFEADKFGRFAVIDKVKVLNPQAKTKGGREIDTLRPEALREADWNCVRQKGGLVQYTPKVYAYCKLSAPTELLQLFMPMNDHFPGWHRFSQLVRCGLICSVLLRTLRDRGRRDAAWLLKCGLAIRRRLRSVVGSPRSLKTGSSAPPPFVRPRPPWRNGQP